MSAHPPTHPTTARLLRRRRRPAAAIVAMALVAAACSDDGNDDRAVPTDPVDTAVETVVTDVPTAPDTTPDTTAPATTEPAPPPTDAAPMDDGEVGSAPDDDSTLPEGFAFEGAFVSHWAQRAADSVALGAGNTMPVLDATAGELDGQRLLDGVWFWDVWPVRDTTGAVADVDGWTMLMGLAADITDDRVPGDRHGIATWRAVATRDGEEWVDLGAVFGDGNALGGRQWAGSSVWDDEAGELTMFYTALGDLPNGAQLEAGPASSPFEDVAFTGGVNLDTPGPDRQEIVQVTASVDTSGDAPVLTGFSPHEIVLIADGEIYRTAEQSANGEGPYVFRDPWWFTDGEREFLMFAASAATAPGAPAGVVGLATRVDGDWVPLPPLVSAQGVNSQLERPHLVTDGERYHLFVSTHGFSFVSGLDEPAGLYGFVADHLRGRYVPLNGSGLVMANPPEAPQQAYSWVVVPAEDGPVVLSFVNYVDLGDVGLDGIGDESPQWQRDHFGGTPAPLVGLDIDGETTTVGEVQPLATLAG